MKTRFHISMTWGCPVLTRWCPGSVLRSLLLRRSMWSSEQGPQGPVAPISQKLSFLLPWMMCDWGR